MDEWFIVSFEARCDEGLPFIYTSNAHETLQQARNNIQFTEATNMGKAVALTKVKRGDVIAEEKVDTDYFS